MHCHRFVLQVLAVFLLIGGLATAASAQDVGLQMCVEQVEVVDVEPVEEPVEACWETSRDICNCRDDNDCAQGCSCFIALACDMYAPCYGSCRCAVPVDPAEV